MIKRSVALSAYTLSGFFVNSTFIFLKYIPRARVIFIMYFCLFLNVIDLLCVSQGEMKLSLIYANGEAVKTVMHGPIRIHSEKMKLTND